MDLEKIKHCLTGPIPSLRTPFNVDGSIDFYGLENNINLLLEQDISTIMLTAGDSHYDSLADNEIAEITTRTVQQVNGKAMVIAADRYHTTERAIDFARFCKQKGADLYMALPPDWARSSTPESLAEHYAAISQIMPVMIVTNRFIPRGEKFGLQTVEKSLGKSNCIMAIKDDMGGRFAWKVCILAHEFDVPVISGGQKSSHLNLYPYGPAAYLSTFIHFRPDLTREYWTAITKQNISQAARVVATYDIPYFDFVIEGPGGFDAGIQATMELFGVYKRYRRRPYYTYTEDDMHKLQTFLHDLGLYPRP